jgi:isocitrate dehydrogenase
MMLQHIGQGAVAERVANAWLRALEDGVHTADIYDPAVSAKKVGTQDFADAVIARLGRLPEVLQPVRSTAGLTPMTLTPPRPAQPVRKEWVGVDVFLDWRGGSAEQLGHMVKELATTALPLLVITNRGVKVYPGGLPQTLCVDHWRCRFLAPQGSVQWADLALLLDRLHRGGLDVIKLENLYRFDGQNGYAAVHG